MENHQKVFKSRFFYLFLVIIFYIAATTILRDMFITNNNEQSLDIILAILFSLIIVSCILILSRSKIMCYLAILLAIITLSSHILIMFVPLKFISQVILIFYISNIFFLGLVTFECLSALIREDRITTDVFFGAISGYFLLGFTWTFVFIVIECQNHQAFSVNLLTPSIHETIINFFYYSFSTLTTIGAGNILPITNPAKTCTWLEAITAQMYLAIWISHLVGLRIYKMNH